MIFYIIIIMVVNPIFLLPLLGAFITQELVTFWSFKKLGGVTGDIYGAVVELSEAISLLLFLGVLEWI
ncbi:MAG TPA: adenosylcobinamide-GDP ribazoletransferase, partial [Tissierellaceae bacterium]